MVIVRRYVLQFDKIKGERRKRIFCTVNFNYLPKHAEIIRLVSSRTSSSKYVESDVLTTITSHNIAKN